MDNLFGRTQIFTSVTEFNRDNINSVIQDCLTVHNTNANQIDYLYGYYKGKQDVLQRTKTFNDYVCNQIVENRAKEIVDFKTAFLVGDAIKYSSNDEEYADAVDELNDLCHLEGKDSVDYDLVEWMNIGGVGYRLILPRREGNPFFMVSLDPRTAFVAYSSRIPHDPVLCCYTTQDDEDTVYSVYAKNADGIRFFEIINDEVTQEEEYTLQNLPIIEYPHGKARLGAFEPCLDLIDAINNLDSNRLDSVEQFVQSLLVLVNCKLPEGYNASNIKEMGLVELISNEQNRADIKQLASTLDQTNTQTLKEDMLSAIRTIVSMPNTAQNSSGGDNGLAVVYRNGWEGAYESAMTDQKAIDASEIQAIRLMLEICEATNTLSIPERIINIDYTRQHYENMSAKSAALIAMLNNEKIHPQVAYEASGMFYDPNKKYLLGLEWYERNKKNNTKEPAEEAPESEPPVEEEVVVE